jgi:hypothetical protein
VLEGDANCQASNRVLKCNKTSLANNPQQHTDEGTSKAAKHVQQQLVRNLLLCCMHYD